MFGLKKEKKNSRLNAPFLGSRLESGEKEAMAAILIEVMKVKGKKLGEKIFVPEFNEIVEKMDEENNLPTVYKFFLSACWNACHQMADEGLLTLQQKEREGEQAYIVITEKLFTILGLDIPK